MTAAYEGTVPLRQNGSLICSQAGIFKYIVGRIV